MKNLYLIFFLIISGSLYAQSNLENANWIFGNTASWLDFNNGTLVSPAVPAYGTSVTSVMPNPVYNNGEGCASISDEDGNLLFYTDGQRVYKKVGSNIEIIDWNSGANQLMGNASSVQNTVIIPRPNMDGRYYLVAANGFSSYPYGLYWSEFDSNTNQFISINNVMSEGTNNLNVAFFNTSESITACVASNGVDMWIITHMKNNAGSYSKLLAYSVTSAGIAATPVTYTMPLPEQWQTYSLKVSPDTSLLALAKKNANPMIGTFNNTTGAITLNTTTPVGNVSNGISNTCYSVEFSPNGQILYFSRWYTSSPPNTITGIFAVDLSNPTVETNVINSGNNNNELGTLQRALNNRIYVARSGSSTIKEIANPNSYGSWTVNDVSLTTGSSRYGLPQWIWPTCKNTLTLTNADNINGSNSRRERSQWISASNVISASSTTNVVYHAGNFVELTPGFESRFGSRTSAYIRGCTNTFVYKEGNSGEFADDTTNQEVIKGFVVSPNPSSNFIDLSVKNDTFSKIVIVSMDGKIILERSVEPTSSYNIDVARYASGVYLVNVISVNGKQYSQKLIKN